MKAAIVFHLKSFLAQAHAEEPQPKATKRHHEEGLLHTRGCGARLSQFRRTLSGLYGYMYIHICAQACTQVYIYICI